MTVEAGIAKISDCAVTTPGGGMPTRAARVPILLVLVGMVWSRAWIGWWSLIPIALIVDWTMVNPRVFPAPRTLDSWASRSVLGEAVWARRKETPTS
jgi:Family of unknown function (DUF6653)